MSRQTPRVPLVVVPTTTEQAFPGILSRTESMFSVKGGTPALDALEHAVTLIDLALRETEQVASDLDNTRLWSTGYLLEMAYTLSHAAMVALAEKEQ